MALQQGGNLDTRQFRQEFGYRLDHPEQLAESVFDTDKLIRHLSGSRRLTSIAAIDNFFNPLHNMDPYVLGLRGFGSRLIIRGLGFTGIDGVEFDEKEVVPDNLPQRLIRTDTRSPGLEAEVADQVAALRNLLYPEDLANMMENSIAIRLAGGLHLRERVVEFSYQEAEG